MRKDGFTKLRVLFVTFSMLVMESYMAQRLNLQFFYCCGSCFGKAIVSTQDLVCSKEEPFYDWVTFPGLSLITCLKWSSYLRSVPLYWLQEAFDSKEGYYMEWIVSETTEISIETLTLNGEKAQELHPSWTRSCRQLIIAEKVSPLICRPIQSNPPWNHKYTNNKSILSSL